MKALYIPSGPKNLQAMFLDVDFSQVYDYYVQLPGVMQTNTYLVDNGCDDSIRIIFMNYLGAVADGVAFCKQDISHEATSIQNQVPAKYPRQITAQSITRGNVASNDTWTVVTDAIDEDGQQWLDELFDSPAAFMQITGTQGQPDSYVAIEILDQKTAKFKSDDRYDYPVTLQFKLSNERISVRNNPSQAVFMNPTP